MAPGNHDDGRRGPLAPFVPGTHPLALGELSEADIRELEALKLQIHRRSGLFCDGYKQKCLRRRLAVRMRARGIHRYADYARLLDSDPAEYDRLLAAVMINVSKFFRNAEVWQELRTRVLPDLMALDGGVVRCWSAGAASGEEAYSLAILLLEYAMEHGCHARLRHFQILGSDLDRDSLADARRAEYGEIAFTETPQEIRERWFEPGRLSRLRPEPRRMVRFEESDLIMGEFPRDQRLILCRNVIIYFERAVQETLFRKFREALVPGGFLVLGKVETLFGPIAGSFRPVAARERIFRRL